MRGPRAAARRPRRLGTASRLLAGLLLAAGGGWGWSQAGVPVEATYEQRVKAAFVYELTNYLRWPEVDAARPFVIGVLGPSAIVGPLREIAGMRRVGGRDILVRELSGPAGGGDCDVLLIAGSAVESPEEVCAAVAGRPTLVVGEADDYARRGVAVNFYLDQGRVRLEVNLAALESARIEASSKLLRLARLVDGGGGRQP